MNTSAETLACWEAARKVRENAHAPYSAYRVGAALITRQSPEIFIGCNVENASYGATVCAERSAVFAAVSALGTIRIREIVLVTRSPAPPCGMCLQVLTEFSDEQTRITLASPEALSETRLLREFLPLQFSPTHLEPTND